MSNYSLYFDDSGTSRWPTVRSYCRIRSNRASWLAFEPVWKNTLAKHNISEPFHMTDFFSTTSVKERAPALRDLADIIVNHAHAAFTGAGDMAAYRKVNAEYALQEYLGAPYALAGRAMALGINQWVQHKLGPSDHLTLFAEDGTKYRGDLVEVFKRDGLPEPRTVPTSVPGTYHMVVQAILTALDPLRVILLRRLDRVVSQSLADLFYGHAFLQQVHRKGVAELMRVALRKASGAEQLP